MQRASEQESPDSKNQEQRVSLLFLALAFLKVGLTAWGGFMALVSIVQGLLVERRRLLTAEEMLDGISLGQLLPGPMAVNVVSYAGYRLGRGAGALVSATAVLLPSFFLVIGLTWVWMNYGNIPAIDSAMAGFPPAIAAIIISAGLGMAKKSLAGKTEVLLAVSSAGLLITVGGFYLTISVIAVAACVGQILWFRRSATMNPVPATRPPVSMASLLKWGSVTLFLLILLAAFLLFAEHPVLLEYPLLHLFSLFGGMSLMLFGGGFVFIPMIQETVVGNLQWITAEEFSTALAIGQVTPGPILVSATVIGFRLHGLAGALVATVGIFLPPSLLMIMASQALETIKGSPAVQASLRGIRAAITGLVFAASVTVMKTATAEWPVAVIFFGSLVSLIRFRIDVIWIIPAAGLLGLWLL